MPQSATTYRAHTSYVNAPIQAKPTPAWMDINAWRQIQGKFAIDRASMSDAALKEFENFCKKNNISFTQKLSNKNGQIIEITNNSNLFKNLLEANAPQFDAQRAQPTNRALNQFNEKSVATTHVQAEKLNAAAKSAENTQLYNKSIAQEKALKSLTMEQRQAVRPVLKSKVETVNQELKQAIQAQQNAARHLKNLKEAPNLKTAQKTLSDCRAEVQRLTGAIQSTHAELNQELRQLGSLNQKLKDEPFNLVKTTAKPLKATKIPEVPPLSYQERFAAYDWQKPSTWRTFPEQSGQFYDFGANSTQTERAAIENFFEKSGFKHSKAVIKHSNGTETLAVHIDANKEALEQALNKFNNQHWETLRKNAPIPRYKLEIEKQAEAWLRQNPQIDVSDMKKSYTFNTLKDTEIFENKLKLTGTPQSPGRKVTTFPNGDKVYEVKTNRSVVTEYLYQTSSAERDPPLSVLRKNAENCAKNIAKYKEDIALFEKQLDAAKKSELEARLQVSRAKQVQRGDLPKAQEALKNANAKLAAVKQQSQYLTSIGREVNTVPSVRPLKNNAKTPTKQASPTAPTNNATPKRTPLKTPQPAMAAAYEGKFFKIPIDSLQAAQPEIAATKTITPPEVVQPHTPQPTTATTKLVPTPKATPLTSGWRQALSVAGKAAGTGLGLFGTVYEGTEAAQAFEKGDNLEGAYHTANTLAYGGATAGIFVGGALGAGMITAGGVAGSIQLGVEAVKDAQKGHYSSAALEAAGAAYFGHATLSGSMFLSAGTAVSAAPVAVTTAAVAGSAALGWKAGRWIDSTFIDPARNYSMDVKDSAKLVGDRMKNVSLGEQPAYLAGFMNSFNDGFDAVSTGWGFKAQWNRLTTSNESRKNKLLEEIANNPQAAYEKGVKGLGGNKGIGANAFLIHESINAGAKPREFNDLSATKNDIHPASKAVKSDISQTFYMNVSNNEEINNIAQAKTALFLIQNGAGYMADDLAEAARSNNELMTDALLLSVKDNQTGKVRMLYDMNDAQKWDYTPPTATEEFILPKEMRTPENMNTLMREAIKANEVTPFKVSAIQQAFNNEGQMKIAEDVLTETISNPQKHLSDSIEDKENAQEAVLSAICGNKEAGYRFHAWQITPAVVSAVKNLDPERKEAFIRYAQETNLGKDNPEMQAALKELAPTDETQAQNTQSTQKDETKSESPAPSQKDEKDSAGKGDESNNNPSGKTVIERQGLGTKVNVDEAEQQPLERNNGATR